MLNITGNQQLSKYYVNNKQKKGFLFITDAGKTRNWKFHTHFWCFSWKLLKKNFFQKSVFPFDACVNKLVNGTKMVKDIKINPTSRRRMLEELIAVVLLGFWANLKNFCASNVQNWIRRNKLCSELNQFFSEMVAEKISYYQSWVGIVQNPSWSIPGSGLTS